MPAATTFNPAGLNPGTGAEYGGTPQPTDITNYRVDGEILGNVRQQSVGGTLAQQGQARRPRWQSRSGHTGRSYGNDQHMRGAVERFRSLAFKRCAHGAPAGARARALSAGVLVR